MTNGNPESDPQETKVELSEDENQSAVNEGQIDSSGESEADSAQQENLPNDSSEGLPEKEAPPEDTHSEEVEGDSGAAAVEEEEPTGDSEQEAASDSEEQAAAESESSVEDRVEIPNAAPHEEVEDSEADDSSQTDDTEDGEPISSDEVQERLNAERHNVVSVLFTNERPSQQELTDVLESYSSVLQDAGKTDLPVADEFGKLTATVDDHHRECLDDERGQLQQLSEEISSIVDRYNDMFVKIEDLGKSIDSVVQAMDEDEQFNESPEEMRDLLLNYRKGIEILLRMATRMQSRKKEMTVDPPGLSDKYDDEATPENFVNLADTVTSLTKKFHDLRDVNYRALHDAKDQVSKSRQAVLSNIKGLFGVIDGIDRGFQDSDQTKSTFEQFAEHQDLAAKWLGSYETLNQIIGDFLESIGVKSLTVKPGDPYETNTMDPIATEEHPEFEDESVASLSARGLSWDDELIRPIQVVVVKNPQS